MILSNFRESERKPAWFIKESIEDKTVAIYFCKFLYTLSGTELHHINLNFTYDSVHANEEI